jgi:chaperonin cofactor prefoldin
MRVLYLLTLILLALPEPAKAEQIKMYLDDTYQKFIMVEQQDCSVHKTEDGRITLGLKIGNFLVNAGPEITFGKIVGIDWDRTVQTFIARYQELCSRFNTGSLTKKEYDVRLTEMERIDNEAYQLHLQYLREKEKHKQDMFDELDKDIDKASGTLSRIKREYDRINGSLEELHFTRK